MRHRFVMVWFASTVCAATSNAQQPAPADTAHAAVADTTHADSTAKARDAKSPEGSHSKFGGGSAERS